MCATKAGPSQSTSSAALKIWEEIKNQVELTFNPRTNGAKIAGRCPDTQTIETEVDRLHASDAVEGDVKENFSEDRFALELARNITEDERTEHAFELGRCFEGGDIIVGGRRYG